MAVAAAAAAPSMMERRGSRDMTFTRGASLARSDGGNSVCSSTYSSETYGYIPKKMSHHLHMNENFRILVRWLETEVKHKLQVLDHKLDNLTFSVQCDSRLSQVDENSPSLQPTTSFPPRRFASPIRPSKSPRSRGEPLSLMTSGRPPMMAGGRQMNVFGAAAHPPATPPCSNGERFGDQVADILRENGLEQAFSRQTSPGKGSGELPRSCGNSAGSSPTNAGRISETKQNDETDSTPTSYDLMQEPNRDGYSSPGGAPRLTSQKSEIPTEGGRSDTQSQGATPRLSHTARQVWLAMEDTDSNPLAKWYSRFMPGLCFFSVLLSLLQTAEPPPIEGQEAAILELAVDLIFILEITMRFLVCPSKRRFLTDEYNVIDLFASFPILTFRFAVGFTIPAEGDTYERQVLLCVAPVLRLLKAIRHLPKFPLLVMSCKLALEALPTLLYALAVMTLVFASLVYYAEPRENIPTLPKAMWLTMVTMTTVGYGDTIPKSTAGNLIVSVLVISSVLFMAMPLGIIGQAFNQIWQDRDCILLARGTRARLIQWGYTADDIPVLFRAYGDGSGELSLHDFRDMMQRLAIGLSEARTVELFHAFDDDSSGSIDAEEFTRRLFPQDYFRIYGGKGSSSFADYA